MRRESWMGPGSIRRALSALAWSFADPGSGKPSAKLPTMLLGRGKGIVGGFGARIRACLEREGLRYFHIDSHEREERHGSCLADVEVATGGRREGPQDPQGKNHDVMTGAAVGPEVAPSPTARAPYPPGSPQKSPPVLTPYADGKSSSQRPGQSQMTLGACSLPPLPPEGIRQALLSCSVPWLLYCPLSSRHIKTSASIQYNSLILWLISKPCRATFLVAFSCQRFLAVVGRHTRHGTAAQSPPCALSSPQSTSHHTENIPCTKGAGLC